MIVKLTESMKLDWSEGVNTDPQYRQGELHDVEDVQVNQRLLQAYLG